MMYNHGVITKTQSPRGHTRVNLTFPADLLADVAAIVAPRRRNQFIVDATADAVRRMRLAQVIGRLRLETTWTDERHPELAGDADVASYVDRLRGAWPGRSWEALAPDSSGHA